MDRKIERRERSEQLGAYGFRLVAADGLELPDLAPVPAGAETVSLEWRFASALQDREVVGEDHLRMSLRRWGHMDVLRSPPTVVCSLPEPVTGAAVVHPLSTMPLAFLSHWRGRVTLHGGAFLHGGRAWLVVGEQMAGKSSMLVGLAQRGQVILADDLIVVDGGAVLAGPSCVDLRPDVAAQVPGARSLGTVMARERFRLSTASGPSRVPVGGLFVLEWGDAGSAPELLELTAEERLRVFYSQHYAGPIGPPHVGAVMELLDVPAWRVRRSRDWAGAAGVLDQLLAVAA